MGLRQRATVVVACVAAVAAANTVVEAASNVGGESNAETSGLLSTLRAESESSLEKALHRISTMFDRRVEAGQPTTSRLGFMDDAEHDEGIFSSGSALLPGRQLEGKAGRERSGKASRNIREEAGLSHSFETAKAGPLKVGEFFSAIKMEASFARGGEDDGVRSERMEEAFLAVPGENDEILSEWTKEAFIARERGNDEVVVDAWKREVEERAPVHIIQRRERARMEEDGLRRVPEGGKLHAVFDFADPDESGREEREGRAKVMENWDVDPREASTDSATTAIYDYGYVYVGVGEELDKVIEEELVAGDAEIDPSLAYPELESSKRDFERTGESAIGLDEKTRPHSGSVASAILSRQARSGDIFSREANDRAQQQRRRMSTTTSQEDAVTYYVEVKASTGATSTDWNNASWALEVGNPVPGQIKKQGTVLGRGEISPGEPEEETVGYTVERGCYVIYTTPGTRPFDVVWSVSVNGEAIEGASGGGSDRHSFGVGGALCDLSTCYRECYEERDDRRTNECASYGDLLAPPTELAGANCTCTDADELELRLECLNLDYCDARSQCYWVDSAISEVSDASVIAVLVYIMSEGASVDKDAAEIALAMWLNLDPSYVELVLVDGSPPASSRRRALLDYKRLDFDPKKEEVVHRNLRWDRRLQTTGTYKRLEFLIIAYSETDLIDISGTITDGVRGLNTVLAAQDEESGLSTAEAYTASYTIGTMKVAAADVPDAEIAGTGDGGVDESGQIVVEATAAPVESEKFYTSTQFLVGAGLVVVVSFVLSIVACVVCHMKRRERKRFAKKNAPVDGRPKPVQFVDPWGSVARDFSKTKKATPSVVERDGNNSQINGNGSRAGGGSSVGNGSTRSGATAGGGMRQQHRVNGSGTGSGRPTAIGSGFS